MKDKLIKYSVYSLIVPLALLWDLVYGAMGLLYNGMTYIDDVGGQKLNEISERVREL